MRRLGQRRGYIDLFWPGKLLVEHKSLGKNPSPGNYNLFAFNQRADAEYQLSALRDSGSLSQGAWGDFTLGSVNDMLSSGSAGEGLKPGGSYGLQPPANWLDPIGAFYDSQSAAYDNAASIASKTTRAMNANGQALSAAQLAALDTNGDGQISTAEAGSLRLWVDLNENGTLEAGELQGVANAIKAADYGFYTRGNGRVVAPAQAAPAAPAVNAPSTRAQTLTITPAANPTSAAVAAPNGGVTPGMPTLPTAPVLGIVALPAALSYGGVPASNYRQLRDTDNVYYSSGGGYIVFNASMVKINNGTRNTLIGTDGADSFDASYYAAYPQYFNSSLLVNFLGGGGNDEMGALRAMTTCGAARATTRSMATLETTRSTVKKGTMCCCVRMATTAWTAAWATTRWWATTATPNCWAKRANLNV